MRISVVFPAPFSPTRPTISPACSSSETSSTARVAPNDFEMFASRNSELPPPHPALPPPRLLPPALPPGALFGRRSHFVVPSRRHDAFVHPEPIDVRLEPLVVNEPGHVDERRRHVEHGRGDDHVGGHVVL